MTKWDEFKRGWPPLLSCAWGAGVGLAGIVIYNLGLFANDLESSIGLSRAQFGVAIFAMMIASAITMPFVGWAVDRFGPRWPCIVGAIGFSFCFFELGTGVNSVKAYFIIMAMMGFLGASSSPVGFSQVVASWFLRGRGFALGLMQVGIGICGTVVPLFIAWTIHTSSWRNGFLALSVISLSSVPIALLFLRSKPRLTPIRATRQRDDDGFGVVLRTRLFWQLMLTMCLMSTSFFGLLPHFVPMLRDSGIHVQRAAGIASLVGISIIASRLVVGWLADRFHVRWLGTAICAISGGACLILATGISGLIPLAALMLGIVMGAEGDLMSFLTARYFGDKVFGRAYGWQYGVFVLAGGAGPAWIGWCHDYWGGYRQALLIIAALSIGMILLFQLMPAYPGLADQADNEDDFRESRPVADAVLPAK